MKTIGLCGGSGSGKGAVSAILAQMNIPSVDADQVYRELTSSDTLCLRELAAEFGDGIISNGMLDRRALADIVFSDHSRLIRLNAITHKHILDGIRLILSELRDQGYNMAVVDAPLLFESGFDKECHAVVAVIADKNLRLKRITERDSITVEAAEKRISSQVSDEFLLANSDFLIVNNGTLDELRTNTEFVFNKIINHKEVSK